MGARLPIFSSFFAVVLVLLTALPFTAPFQAFDLSLPAGEGLVPGMSDEKVSMDCEAPALVGETVPLFHSTVDHVRTVEVIGQPQISPTTLRL